MVCRSRGVHIYMREPHQPASRNRAIRWVGDNQVTSLGNSFLWYSFLWLYSTVSEDSRCLIGASDVVNLGLYWWILSGFGRVLYM